MKSNKSPITGDRGPGRHPPPRVPGNFDMKKKLPIILSIIVLLVGLGIFFYPTFANYWNSFTQTKAIETYAAEVENLNEEEYARLMQEAEAYNADLKKSGIKWRMSDEDRAKYSSILNVADTGMIGYIEIAKINVSLPLYHGTSDEVLLRSVGHIEGSSFPASGEGVHCVLSGHRGLPSAKLFSDLDQISEGDTFMIRVLNEVFTYEVDQINIVEPNDLSKLTIDRDKNYCTLVTCTPYGVNTQRLLVRGHMIETEDEREIMILAEALQIKSTYIAAMIAVPVLILLAIVAVAFKPKPHITDPEQLKKRIGKEAEKKNKNEENN